MKESEAKQKWCPMVNFQIGPDNATWQGVAYSNRAQVFEPSATLCLGSGCMAWRETDKGNKDVAGYCGMTRS